MFSDRWKVSTHKAGALGQHFLTNPRILKKIAAGLEIKPGKLIIEIGPGHGELTDYLLKAGAKIIAIEKDKKLAGYLRQKFKIQNIKIIEGDVLKILPALASNSPLPTSNYKLTGNIPYYITGYLLRVLSELKNKPKLIVLTIQKEVAERIIAQPPQMNLLAASVQFWADPAILDIIPKKDFQPIPGVDSAIIKLKPKTAADGGSRAASYYPFIKILFKQPRKTIFNNLRSGGWSQEKIKEICGKLNIEPALRPQNLALKQIRELSAISILGSPTSQNYR